MDARKTLQDFKKKIDPEIEEYFNKVIKEARKKDSLITNILEYVKKLTLAGGKRLRPAFMYYGYLAAGGRERKKMIETAVSIELIHIFLLVHDDIIDRDIKRHGIDTINIKYQKLGKKVFPKADSRHFGNSMAIIVGDLVAALGNQIIFDSGFNPEFIVSALHKLQAIISMTVIGEAQDVYMEYENKATEGKILRMYENKTAKYTIEGPLHLGAILGGAKENILQELSGYAIPTGIAFQIQDDILGVFGSEKKMGKSVGSDISSGKQTILIVEARKNANKEQRRILDYTLGRENLTLEQIENFRKVIKDTGALDYAKNLSCKFIEQGKKAVEKSIISKESKEFLAGVAEYMVKREV